MKVLVTGADGFVGAHLVPKLRAAGHEVVEAVLAPRAGQVSLNLEQPESIAAALDRPLDAVIHLAAMASGGEARGNPAGAWRVNAVGSALLAEAAAAGGQARNRQFLLVSTAEVYGAGLEAPGRETDPLAPTSPYAASKLAAEIGVLEVHRRTGLRVIIARPFPHTGPGQQDRYFVPGIAARIRAAKAARAPAVRVGNLDIVRELLHVDDVADAYVRMLGLEGNGTIYNIAGGRGVRLAEVFSMLCELIGYRPTAERDPSLMRQGDIPYLVGDGTLLRQATGWTPRHTLEATLREVVNAQAD